MKATQSKGLMLALLLFGTTQVSAFYDPSFQRWPNRDPRGDYGGRNLYRCGFNDLLNHIDPFGLAVFPSDFVGPLQPGDVRVNPPEVYPTEIEAETAMGQQLFDLTKVTNWEWGTWTYLDEYARFTYIEPFTDRNRDGVKVRPKPPGHLKFCHSHPGKPFDPAKLTYDFSPDDLNILNAFQYDAILVAPDGRMREFFANPNGPGTVTPLFP